MISVRGTSLVVEQSIFQWADGGSIPTVPLFYVAKIEAKTAKAWVEKWHYSKRMPTGKNICYGCFVSGKLYAVIVYGIGVNPYQASFLKVKSVLEIKRMCRKEPKNKSVQLSKLIGVSLRMLRKEYPCDCVVAFADPEHGHEGTVYKASGFTQEGNSNPEWHLEDADGNRRHRRFAFRHSRRHGITIAESRAVLGLKRVKTLPKHRWVMRFG